MLRIPAAPSYIRLARLVASGYGAQVGGTVDDIDDLRTAVDELCSMLVAHAGANDDIELELSAADDLVRVVAAAPVRKPWEPDELAEGVVTVLADTYESAVAGGRAVLLVEKRLEPASAPA